MSDQSRLVASRLGVADGPRHDRAGAGHHLRALIADGRTLGTYADSTALRRRRGDLVRFLPGDALEEDVLRAVHPAVASLVNGRRGGRPGRAAGPRAADDEQRASDGADAAG